MLKFWTEIMVVEIKEDGFGDKYQQDMMINQKKGEQKEKSICRF